MTAILDKHESMAVHQILLDIATVYPMVCLSFTFYLKNYSILLYSSDFSILFYHTIQVLL